MFAPPKTPRPIVDKLNAAIAQVQSSPAQREFFRMIGGEPAPSTPEELAEFVKAEIGRWAEVARRAGVRIEQ
jgi:tripartite-type tricarboxylate transporter receptor subunit TctC